MKVTYRLSTSECTSSQQ